MFRAITLRGTSAALMWGYRRTAALVSWRVSRTLDEATGAWRWSLVAQLGPHVDRFQTRQAHARKELLLIAPRKGGFWTWAVHDVTVHERSIVATLGPPEH